MPTTARRRRSRNGAARTDVGSVRCPREQAAARTILIRPVTLPNPNPRRLPAALAAAALLAACTAEDGPSPPSGPLPAGFLAPVDWETKRPSAQLVTTSTKLAEWTFASGTGEWEAQHAATLPIDRPRVQGVQLEPAPDAPEGLFGLRLDGLDWDASEIQLVGVKAACAGAGRARLHFLTDADDPQAPFPREQHLTMRTQVTESPRGYAFVPTGHATWVGRIRSIALQFDADAGPVLLESVHAVAQPFLPGASPGVANGATVDAGLVELGITDADPMRTRFQSRRAFPARAERAQAAVFEARDGDVLRFSLALPPVLRHHGGPVEFRLVATPARGRVPAADTPALFEETLDPSRDAGRWHASEVALPDTEGEEWELWLETSGGRPAGAVNGLWGPLLVDRPGAPREPSLLVVTADTLRADHVGFLRDEYGLDPLAGLETPHLDALFARGTVFPDCLATCNSTSPSHVSIFTSLHVRDHGVISNEQVLPEAHRTLGELLSESGRFAFASSTARHLNSSLSGLGQGMHAYLESPPVTDLPDVKAVADASELPPASTQTVLFATLHYQLPGVLGLLDEIGEAPFYAWLHCFDAHTPYVPRPEVLARLTLPPDEGELAMVEQLGERYYATSGAPVPEDPGQALTDFLWQAPHLAAFGDLRSIERARALYAASVTQLDGDLGRLFDELEVRDRLADTLIAFTADHGESLGERDIWFGHEGLYDNTLRVPLAFAGPGVPAGEVHPSPTMTVDLLPTVCELLGLDLPPTVTGRSLVEVFAGELAPDRMRHFESASGFAVGRRSATEHAILNAVDHRRGTFDQRVSRGTLELYAPQPDGTFDGPEREVGDAEHAARVDLELREWLLNPVVDLGVAERAALSASDQRVLELLGYLNQ